MSAQAKHKPLSSKRRTSDVGRRASLTILALFIILAITYSLNSPIYEPTDELRHFRYVRHIAVYHNLPEQSAEGPRAQSHHPPLYYTLGALVSGWLPVAEDVYYEPLINPHWDNRVWEVSADNKNQYLHGGEERFPFHGVARAVYAVRWMTILIGAGVVWLTGLIGCELFPSRPALVVGGMALVAFNPQFLYLSGAINNDIPSALCSAAVLLTCLRLVKRGPSRRIDVVLGILYGLALLTKFHLLALLVPIELAYILALWRDRAWRSRLAFLGTFWSRFASLRIFWSCFASLRTFWSCLAFLRGNFIILGLTSIISGWWFWRNRVLYGDFTGMNKVNQLWAGRPASENLWAIRQSLPYLWSSLWGRFGYGQLPLPQVVYQVLLIFCVLALMGCLISRRHFSPHPSLLSILTVTVIIFTAVVLYYILIQPAGAMGRFLFPALPAFAFLIVGGMGRLFPRRLHWWTSLILFLGMAALAIYALVGVLTPAFGAPRSLTQSEIQAAPNPMDVKFGNLARLLGYRVTPEEIKPGDTLKVTLYWQALAHPEQNYVLFVHLLSDAGPMIAQRDTHPGLGRYPTTAWEPGVAFADTYRLHLPETAYAPDAGYIQVGFYLPGGPRLVTPDGRNAVRLTSAEISPRPGEYPNPLDANFDDQITLVGYELDRRAVQPGQTIHLTLYWRALAKMETDYGIFAHVRGRGNQIWGRHDGQPAGGAAPTSQWQPGPIIKDTRSLKVGATTPLNFYDIEVGLYTSGGDRLFLIGEDGHQLNNRLLLSKIQVVSK